MSRLLCLPALFALALTARADILSGPKAGEKVADFKVFGVVGLIEGKEGSYVRERKDAPTVYVFIQQEHWSRPMAGSSRSWTPRARRRTTRRPSWPSG